MKRESIVIYRATADALSELDADEYKDMMQAIFSYAFDGIEPTPDTPSKRMAWKFAKPQLDACLRKFEAQVENGRKGGIAKANNRKAKDSQGVANCSQSVANDSQRKPRVTLNEKWEMRNEKGENLIPSSSSYAHEDENHLFERTVKIGMVPRKMG